MWLSLLFGVVPGDGDDIGGNDDDDGSYDDDDDDDDDDKMSVVLVLFTVPLLWLLFLRPIILLLLLLPMVLQFLPEYNILLFFFVLQTFINELYITNMLYRKNVMYEVWFFTTSFYYISL